jgi:tRNA threonylcarbamoyladenosine biosynthesis protein TsaE
MKRLVYEAAGEAETERLGRALAQLLFPGAVVALDGTLGAGKTRLVQALAVAAGADPRAVVSPTFVLVQEYRGKLPIYHFDAYRLRDEDEFQELGPEEYFAGSGWSLVEWANRVPRCLPAERLEIGIEVSGETARRFEIVGRGESYERLVDDLREVLQTEIAG